MRIFKSLASQIYRLSPAGVSSLLHKKQFSTSFPCFIFPLAFKLRNAENDVLREMEMIAKAYSRQSNQSLKPI